MSNRTRSQQDADVRMRGFLSRATVDEALRWIDSQTAALPDERVPLAEAHDRVLALDMTSAVDVPGFQRAMMDGFAVQAADTSGASAYQPRPLDVIGQSLPGCPFPGELDSGQAVRIMTGAPMPAGADAVLPVERVDVERTDAVDTSDNPIETAANIVQRIFALHEVPPGKHTGCVGEDIPRGARLLPAGRRLRPQDLGALSSIGVGAVPVVRRPRVQIVTTGNELLPAGSQPHGYQITDANSPMLVALVERDGGLPLLAGIVPDDRDAILDALRADANVVLVSGGSSVGQEDHVPTLLAEHGELAIHGIAMRPSSPTGMGRLGDRLVFLLPGNPVSCLCGYDFFAGRAIRALGGRSTDWPYRQCSAPLRRKLVSVVGRVDYARVAIVDGGVEPLAIAGASILSSATRADGFVIIPADSEGLAENRTVEVYLYD